MAGAGGVTVVPAPEAFGRRAEGSPRGDAPRAADSERVGARQPEAGSPAVQAVGPMRRLAAEWMGVSVRRSGIFGIRKARVGVRHGHFALDDQ
jgi:hypothetical protein